MRVTKPANGRMLISAAALICTFLVGCSKPASQTSATVAVDGSSTVYPITEAVAEEFQGANPNTRVTVGIAGTGGGFKKFLAGEIDINDASRPILAEEVEIATRSNL